MFLPCDYLLKEDHLQDASLHRNDRFQLPKNGDHRQCSQWHWRGCRKGEQKTCTNHITLEQKRLNPSNQFVIVSKLRNSYTMGCPHVRGDNTRALASGLSYVQVGKHGITILYHQHQCRPCTPRDISC